MDYKDILPHEVVKVLVEYDDIEEELWAKVVSNEGTHIFVTYMSPTNKVYKGACVHNLEPCVNRVDYECITEHYNEIKNLEYVGWREVKPNVWVYETEIDDEEVSSEIEDMSDDESEYSIDEEAEAVKNELPPDHREIDAMWNSWQPTTSGGRHFKDTVDRIEERVRILMDEQDFKNCVE